MLTIYYILEYTKSEGVEDMRKFVICLVMLLLVSSPASACIGARQASMGWAGVAISDDATASYWNPAALVWAKDGFMYGSIWGSKDFAAKYDSFGFHYVQDWNKSYWQVGYGHLIDNNTAIGFNIGWSEYDYGHPHPSADLSFAYKRDNVSFGVLAQDFINIRPEFAYSTKYITIVVGSYDLFDMCRHFNDDGGSLQKVYTGLELRPTSYLALRGGRNSGYEELIYGAGISLSFFRLDFAHIMKEDCFSVVFTL